MVRSPTLVILIASEGLRRSAHSDPSKGWVRHDKVEVIVREEAMETPALVQSQSPFNPFPTREQEQEASPRCCGQAMEPRLTRMRDREGEVSFVAVWRCPRCGRVLNEC